MTTHKYSFGYLFLCFLLVSSCATGAKVENLDYPIGYLHDAIQKTLPAPLAGRSENGRNYSTKAYAVPLFYRKKPQPPKSPPSERAYATISIHGITRPYTINVRVDIEDLISGPKEKPQYVTCCRHPEMEKELLKTIQDYLVKRYKNPNMIDDFRVF